MKDRAGSRIDGVFAEAVASLIANITVITDGCTQMHVNRAHVQARI